MNNSLRATRFCGPRLIAPKGDPKAVSQTIPPLPQKQDINHPIPPSSQKEGIKPSNTTSFSRRERYPILAPPLPKMRYQPSDTPILEKQGVDTLFLQKQGVDTLRYVFSKFQLVKRYMNQKYILYTRPCLLL